MPLAGLTERIFHRQIGKGGTKEVYNSTAGSRLRVFARTWTALLVCPFNQECANVPFTYHARNGLWALVKIR